MSPSTRMMCTGLAISLGWILFEGCPCEQSKQDKYSGEWVTCQGDQPTLMHYYGNIPAPSSTTPNFDPKQWSCKHPDSPHYKNSSKGIPPPFPSYGPGGPLSSKTPRAASSGSVTAYIPKQLRWLPFLPHVPPPGTPPPCDASSPDLLQTNHTNSLVTRIATCPFQIKATIPVVSRPLQIDITPDGSTALVTSFDNAVNFIDLATNKVTFTLTTDVSVNPHGLAITPDGKRFYITSFNQDNHVVLLYDMTSHAILATIPSIQFPQGATLTPDGSQLWITSPLAQSMQVIDTLTNTVVTQLAIGQTTDVAFNSTGTRAYVTSGSGFVVVVDTATYQRIKSYQVGAGPGDIAMSYADEFLVVDNWAGNSVSIIDLVQDKVTTTAVGANPGGIVFVK